MRKWEVPALIPIICSLLLCACIPNIESKSPDPVEADKEADSSADQKIKKQKDNKSEMSDYDGTWYEQMPGGGILTVEDGICLPWHHPGRGLHISAELRHNAAYLAR